MRRLATLAALLLLSACTATTPAQSGSPEPSNPASRFQTTEPLPSAGAPSGVPTTVSDARLAAIRADLTKRGVASDQVRVVSAQSVTFNDGSLGCPAPGVQYTQAQVEGARVVVEAAGRTYDYRFGANEDAKLCENPAPQSANTTR